MYLVPLVLLASNMKIDNFSWGIANLNGMRHQRIEFELIYKKFPYFHAALVDTNQENALQ